MWAASRLPYLASALFASEVRPAPSSGTIGINRAWRIDADPDVLDALSVEQLGRLLIHLVGHVVRDHAARAERIGVTDRARWNRAADAELNDDLDGCVPAVAPDLPGDLGCDPGRFAEHYYEAAIDGPRVWDCGPGCDGSGDDGHGPVSPRHGELLRLATAAEIGRHPGDVPEGWRRWAEAVLPSKTDWRRVLAAEVRSAVAAVAGQVDYSYRRPSRRAQPDVILPTLHRPIPDVAIVCDTSGSMHEDLLARALAEVENVLSRAGLRQRQVRVLAVDATVHAVRRVSRADPGDARGRRRDGHGRGHRGGRRAPSPPVGDDRADRRLHAVARPLPAGDAGRGGRAARARPAELGAARLGPRRHHR